LFRERGLAEALDLEIAFDEALTHVERLLATDMKTSDGASARPQLEKLEGELKSQRVRALKRGTIDREWFQKTLRWVVEWVPDTDLTLIASLGRIVRSAPPALS